MTMDDYKIKRKGNVVRLGIKNINTIGWIEESWKNRDPHLYGRFDLGYDPQSSSVKMMNRGDRLHYYSRGVLHPVLLREIAYLNLCISPHHLRFLDRIRYEYLTK